MSPRLALADRNNIINLKAMDSREQHMIEAGKVQRMLPNLTRHPDHRPGPAASKMTIA
jgi:hypothetical protein